FGYTTPDSRLKLVACESCKVCLTVGLPAPPPAEVPQATVRFPEVRFPEWSYRSTAFGQMLVGSRDCEAPRAGKALVLWERGTGRMVRRLRVQPDLPKDKSWYPIFSPDGRFVVVPTSESRELSVYETASARLRGQIRAPNGIHSISFAPDGKTLATSCEDTGVLIWDLNRP